MLDIWNDEFEPYIVDIITAEGEVPQEEPQEEIEMDLEVDDFDMDLEDEGHQNLNDANDDIDFEMDEIVEPEIEPILPDIEAPEFTFARTIGRTGTKNTVFYLESNTIQYAAREMIVNIWM